MSGETIEYNSLNRVNVWHKECKKFPLGGMVYIGIGFGMILKRIGILQCTSNM